MNNIRISAMVIIAAGTLTFQPQVVAAAERAREFSVRILKGLKIAQQALIAKAYWQLGEGINHVRQNLVGQTQIRYYDSLPHVAVRKVNPEDDYPTYELESDFSRKQALQVSWKTTLDSGKEFHGWVDKNWTSQRTCGATLEDKDNQFTAKLSEAKSFLKSWFYL